jgi:pimeloyl-ACP methyl ester carboxylesterase
MGASVHIGTGRVAYDSRGDGPAVVLSHASLVDRRMWRAQLDTLSASFHVVAWDRLGYGESDPAPPSVRHGADLLRLLDLLGISRAALVGSSMGGGYSLDAALAAPDRVSALALICPGVPGYVWPDEMLAEISPLMAAAVPRERLASYAAHTATSVLDPDIVAMAEAQQRYMTVGPGRNESVFDPETWAFLLEMTRGVFARLWREPTSAEVTPDPPLLDRLASVSAPTLLINGRSDVRFVQDLGRRLSAGIPNAHRVDLDDTGHLPPVERPDAVNTVLLDWLRSQLLR